MNDKVGKLSVVATPIGNLEDMTHRAERILEEADYILCEDTRVTGKLLKHYQIQTPTKRYDAHASERVHEQIMADLAEGTHIALVSDAGTPGVSDPGVLLIQQARRAGATIEAIPGPSAVTTAVSIAGLTGNQFTFLGFVPQKKGRQTFFANLGEYEHPVIFFESTHRVMKTLQSLTEVSVAQVALARELTKLHEEFVSGTPEEVLQYFEDNPEHQRGEFVVIVTPTL
ncbi:16S rRNA (cytidine(1402)-2'-O)-methyltransferase [bacterium]|nr:16S rRNA (cytidine(1402)-2'-O)-methyltransferase [bacterium]|tara:strand:+ start:336 stop:1019 length:684 start_codon:yes stop_codon:yes gene_type:complete